MIAQINHWYFLRADIHLLREYKNKSTLMLLENVNV